MKSVSLTLLAASLAATLPATAAERFWDGNDLTGNWNVAANWDANSALNLAADDLNFPTGVNGLDKLTNNNYAAGTIFRNLNFLESGYVVNGASMGVLSGIAAFIPSGTVSINNPVVLQADQSFTVNNGGDLTFSGQISLNGRTLDLQAYHADSILSVNGAISGGFPASIRVKRAGTVKFDGAKTFSANLSIEDGGTLEINNAGGLGDGSGTTEIKSGKLVLNSALGLNVAENLRLTNVEPDDADIISRGGAHTLSGNIEVSGGWFKHINVEGTSLTLTGAMTGNVDIGSVITRGPGRLTLSGSQSNTLDINIFRVWDGELVLNKSGGAQAISAPFLIVGHNGNVADGSIVRLGAADQIADTSWVEVPRDGWFDMNGKNEKIRTVKFTGPGRITGGGGTLRLAVGIDAFSGLYPDTTAVINAPVILDGADSIWNTEGGNSPLNVRVEGPVTSSVPGGKLTKTGASDLAITGVVTVPTVVVDNGSMMLTGNSPLTDVSVEGGILRASGALKKVTAESGRVSVGSESSNATLVTQDLVFGGRAVFNFTSNAPGGHDVIHTAGSVTITQGTHLDTLLLGPADIDVGEEIILINNDGADPISGQFVGEAADQVVSGEYWLSYTGGDGNDLSLTRIVPPTGTTRVWDGGGGGNNSWMTAANWVGDIAPVPGDSLVFPEGVANYFANNNFPAETTFHSITVAGAGLLHSYSLFGSRVRLNKGLYFTGNDGAHVIGFEQIYSLPGTISSVTTGFIQIVAPVDNGGKLLTLHQTDATMEGDIYMSSVVSGAGGILKTGAGPATFFEDANTYTGVTVVKEGVLATNWIDGLGAPGAASGTRVEAGATLLLRGSEEELTCNETITLAGTIEASGDSGVQMNAPLIVEGPDATLDVDLLAVNGSISGTGTLHKTGAGVLTIAGGAANTFSGGFMADEGETRLQKIGSNALPGPVAVVGNAGSPATITLLAANQIADNTSVQIVHSAGALNMGTLSDTVGELVMKGGLVQGGGASQLTLSTGVLFTQAAGSTAVIMPRLAVPANLTGSFTVSEGSAAPDLQLDGLLFGGTIEKKGAGRADLRPSMGAGTLPNLSVLAGSMLVHGQCPQLLVALKGGLIGGNGRVSNITANSSGTVSPGIETGAFGAGQLAWNATTTFRVELNGTDPGAGYDQLLGYGAVNLGGAKLNLSTGFNPAAGATFMILRNISGSAITGTFVNAPENGYVSAPGGKVFQITYKGGDGDDVVLTKIDTAPPEVVSFEVKPDQGKGGDENQIGLVIKGLPGLTYQLESSADLQTWKTLSDSVANLQNGLINFEVFEPESTPRLFFRARLP